MPTIRAELQFIAGALTAIAFLLFGSVLLGDLSSPVRTALAFTWLFAVMLWSSFGVVRHADCLAVLLGEPFGTLILTVAVITIEVIMISAVMLTGENNPALARDTMFAVIMVVLNGMAGFSILLAGLRHGEPLVNLQGANAYLGILVPLSVLTLVVPSFTRGAPGGVPGPVVGVFLVVVCVVLYVVFLGIQTMRHRHYFVQPEDESGPERDGSSGPALSEHADGHAHAHDHPELAGALRGVWYHATFLVLTMIPIVLLSKSMAKIVERGIAVAELPTALGGLLVAVLVLSPEGLAAFRSALANRLQRSINIAMGSALATISLTVPSVLVISMFIGREVELGLGPLDMTMLLLTLATMIVSASGRRTNVLHGVVHVTLFAAYLVLLFD